MATRFVSRIFWFFLGLALLALALGWAIRENNPLVIGGRAWQQSLESLEGMSAEFFRQLNLAPEIQVDSRTVVEGRREILEIATAEAVMRQNYSFVHTHFGSSKKLELEGELAVKAGFSLSDHPFTINIQPGQKRIQLHLPPARILSVETINVRIVEEKQGFWNFLTPTERSHAYNELVRLTREASARGDLPRLATANLQEQVESVLKSVYPDFEVTLVEESGGGNSWESASSPSQNDGKPAR